MLRRFLCIAAETANNNGKRLLSIPVIILAFSVWTKVFPDEAQGHGSAVNYFPTRSDKTEILPVLEFLVPDNTGFWTPDQSDGIVRFVDSTSDIADAPPPENIHSAHARVVGTLAMLPCHHTKNANKINVFGPEEPKGGVITDSP